MSKSNFWETKMFKDIFTGGTTAIIGAIAGAFTTALSVSVNLNDICKNTTKCKVYIETSDGRKIEISKEDITINENSNEGLKLWSILSIFQKPEIDSIRINLSPKQAIELALAIEPSKPLVSGLENQKIAYADTERQIPQVKEWLNNPFSGYQQLVNALTKLLDNRQGIGNAVPLTIIQAKYLNGDTGNPPLTYDQERLKQAYIAAWKEKNSGSSLTTFDEIAPLNP